MDEDAQRELQTRSPVEVTVYDAKQQLVLEETTTNKNDAVSSSVDQQSQKNGAQTSTDSPLYKM